MQPAGNMAAYGIVVNTTVQTSTIFGQQNISQTAQTLSGTAILSLPAGATLTVRNVGATPDILPAAIDGAVIVNASFRIVQMSP